MSSVDKIKKDLISSKCQASLVSAVITTRNRLNLLQRAVESVKQQTYKNIEMIVVDDGSSDNTKDWCNSQSLNYIRIEPGKGRGGNYARNLGIKASKGEYVAFLDDDDYWMPTKIEKQVFQLQQSGNELVHCYRYLEFINVDNSSRIELCPLNSNYKGNLKKRILYQITCLTSAIMVSRKALNEIGGFDENCKYWQEYELTIRLAQRKPFDLVDEPLLTYRINNNDKNRLTNKYDGWKESVRYIYKKHKELYDNLGLLSKLRVKILFLRDSALRAEVCGLTSIYKRHHSLQYVLNIPFRIYDKIKSYI